MLFKEEKRDLFTVDDKYYLCHCISDDFALGAGIAVQFEKRYKLKRELFRLYPEGLGSVGCVLVGKVFNLVTKEKYYHKPTLITLQQSLIQMKELAIQNNIKYIAMPRIGCGLDGLEWNDVRNIICAVFQDTDVKILVCYV